MATLEAIKYSAGKCQILDQLKLPMESVYMEIDSCSQAWDAIKQMNVRGAPAIAIVGCLSLAVELRSTDFDSPDALYDFVRERFDYLVTARPTAIDLANARVSFLELIGSWRKESDAVTTLAAKNKFISLLEASLVEGVDANRSLGEFGAEAILGHYSGQAHKDSIAVLTHCNTGSLATAGYGTALGVIRSLHLRKRLSRAYCTETRPYNQGSRLTAYELVYEEIPGTLICDSTAGALMAQGKVDAVVTGADQVVLNGDTANKIGTYSLAVLARHHRIPFYIAVPSTTINPRKTTGDEIVIEERAEGEVTHVKGNRIAAPGISVWNPSFDVTPAELITGYITEKGVFTAAEITKLYGEHGELIAT